MLSGTTTIHLWQPRGGYSLDVHGSHDANGSHGANSSHDAKVVRLPRSSGESGLFLCCVSGFVAGLSSLFKRRHLYSSQQVLLF